MSDAKCPACQTPLMPGTIVCPECDHIQLENFPAEIAGDDDSDKSENSLRLKKLNPYQYFSQ